MTTQRHDVETTGPIESTEPITDEHYSQPRDQYSQHSDRGGDPSAPPTQSQGGDPYWAGERSGGQRSSGFGSGGQPPVNYGAAQGQSQSVTGPAPYADPAFSGRGDQHWDSSGDDRGQYSGSLVDADPSSSARTGPVPDHGATSIGDTATPLHDASATDSTTTSGTDRSAAHSDTSAGSLHEDSLIAGHDLTGLRSRWNDVQAAFVDDPRECVQRADKLVTDVLDNVTTRLSQARSGLEEQWARGEQASTEDLRLALKRYREFFDRLLAV